MIQPIEPNVRKTRPKLFGALILLLAFILVPPLMQKLVSQPLPIIKITLHEAAVPVPEIKFQNARGESLTLGNFRGSFILLNVWATWCPPCKQEMPSLDRVATQFSANDLQIVSLSIDVSGLPEVRYFYKEMGLLRLSIYVDPSMKSMRELGVVGIPTTLLINREGLEIGQLVGPTKWDDAAIVQQLSSVIRRRPP